MRLGSLTNAGIESSVFIGFVQKGLYKEQADSAAHADAHTCCCLSSSPGIPGALLSLAERGCTNPLSPRCLPGSTRSNHRHVSMRHRRLPAVWAKDPARSKPAQGAALPKHLLAVMTETFLSSHPAGNRTFQFLSLLYIAVIPLN